MSNGPTGAIAVLSELNQSLLSPNLFSIVFLRTKKGEVDIFGRFLRLWSFSCDYKHDCCADDDYDDDDGYDSVHDGGV